MCIIIWLGGSGGYPTKYIVSIVRPKSKLKKKICIRIRSYIFSWIDGRVIGSGGLGGQVGFDR